MDWSFYKGNLTWLQSNTIFVTKHGSQAYGTNIEGSDLDLRGICIPPKKYYLGFCNLFEQSISNEPDVTIFDIKKFFKLASDCNPNALEIIFTEPEDHILTKHPMNMLLENKNLFLSKKAKYTMAGYANSQLRRMKGHYNWHKNPIDTQPKREDFGLPNNTVIPADQLAAAEAAIKTKLDEYSWQELDDLDPSTRIAVKEEFHSRLLELTSWNLDNLDEKIYITTANMLGYDSNFIEYLQKERSYRIAQHQYKSYQKWKKERNPKRAELESKFGYDCKNALHLVRLYRSCEELLLTGKLNVKRHDAEELKQIRAGAWSFEKVLDYAAEMEKKLVDIEAKSTLPRTANIDKLSGLCQEMVEEFWKSNKD
jgi:predicted nucleotidyltransferase